jgi:two-component sensor histidine kinase
MILSYFSVKDNGVGIDSNFKLESADSLGSKIIYLLSTQIKSNMSIYNIEGTLFTFEIKNPKTTALSTQ